MSGETRCHKCGKVHYMPWWRWKDLDYVMEMNQREASIKKELKGVSVEVETLESVCGGIKVVMPGNIICDRELSDHARDYIYGLWHKERQKKERLQAANEFVKKGDDLFKTGDDLFKKADEMFDKADKLFDRVFERGDEINSNKRIYSKGVLKAVFDDYEERTVKCEREYKRKANKEYRRTVWTDIKSMMEDIKSMMEDIKCWFRR